MQRLLAPLLLSTSLAACCPRPAKSTTPCRLPDPPVTYRFQAEGQPRCPEPFAACLDAPNAMAMAVTVENLSEWHRDVVVLCGDAPPAVAKSAGGPSTSTSAPTANDSAARAK